MNRHNAITSICETIRPAFHRLLDAVERNLDGTGLSVPQRGLLQLLLETGAQTVPSMAHRLLVTRQFALRLSNELEAMSLIARRHNPTHKRSDLFELTPEAKELIEQILEREAAAAARALAGLTDEQLVAAAETLRTITTADFSTGAP